MVPRPSVKKTGRRRTFKKKVTSSPNQGEDRLERFNVEMHSG